ncbi:hypothetical protein MPLDJ20_80231 [Mesorhizobium plurifarium]|uniref:Uncharacterized protein n=1 Tax=Mesorhizobium plurifarium TaxID=69974 RepID=A0A090FX23_MESPL|nr:hypothetical protein MPLDJ20_80231 [Mesorhizobium plurifarium]
MRPHINDKRNFRAIGLALLFDNSAYSTRSSNSLEFRRYHKVLGLALMKN